jgi:hypothetical protein
MFFISSSLKTKKPEPFKFLRVLQPAYEGKRADFTSLSREACSDLLFVAIFNRFEKKDSLIFPFLC